MTPPRLDSRDSFETQNSKERSRAGIEHGPKARRGPQPGAPFPPPNGLAERRRDRVVLLQVHQAPFEERLGDEVAGETWQHDSRGQHEHELWRLKGKVSRSLQGSQHRGSFRTSGLLVGGGGQPCAFEATIEEPSL